MPRKITPAEEHKFLKNAKIIYRHEPFRYEPEIITPIKSRLRMAQNVFRILSTSNANEKKHSELMMRVLMLETLIGHDMKNAAKAKLALQSLLEKIKPEDLKTIQKLNFEIRNKMRSYEMYTVSESFTNNEEYQRMGEAEKRAIFHIFEQGWDVAYSASKFLEIDINEALETK